MSLFYYYIDGLLHIVIFEKNISAVLFCSYLPLYGFTKSFMIDIPYPWSDLLFIFDFLGFFEYELKHSMLNISLLIIRDILTFLFSDSNAPFNALSKILFKTLQREQSSILKAESSLISKLRFILFSFASLLFIYNIVLMVSLTLTLNPFEVIKSSLVLLRRSKAFSTSPISIKPLAVVIIFRQSCLIFFIS